MLFFCCFFGVDVLGNGGVDDVGGVGGVGGVSGVGGVGGVSEGFYIQRLNSFPSPLLPFL